MDDLEGLDFNININGNAKSSAPKDSSYAPVSQGWKDDQEAGI